MSANASFGQWLKERRKALHLTQQTLAAKVGCAVITIQKLESNQRRPSHRVTELLAQHLAIPPAEHAAFTNFARRKSPSTPLEARASFQPILTNLPGESTPFLGRHEELVQISALLSDPACRLLTLVGPGGVGKTRLAAEVARRFSGPGSISFVSLQALTSPDYLVPAIAEALQLHFYSGDTPKQQLLNYFRQKSGLLLLDNFEHLLEGTGLLSDILTYAPALHLLVTSRERVNVVEEWVLEVGGLAYPPHEGDVNAERYSAVELFVRQASRAKIDFAVSESNRPAVIRICQLVGGLPLGIELAANWVRILSCEAIAAEIEHSLDILETSARNIEPRHRTMRAAFEPTWQRLSQDKRTVFMNLSVFRGGCTREAAEAVAGASLRTLSALVDKSLLRVDGNGRYNLHELLRQYAVEKLFEAGEAVMTAQRHLDYFLTFAEQVEAHNFGREQIDWYDQAEIELDNLRAALAGSLSSNHAEIGLRMAAALGWFFSERSHWVEGFDWLQKMLAATPDAPLSLRAKALHTASGLTGHLGGDQWTQVLVEQALALARAANDRWNIAWALNHRAMLVEYDPAQKAALMDESLGLFRALDDAMGVTHSLIRRAWIALEQEDYSSMQVLVDEAAIHAHEAGDTIMSSWVFYALGLIAWYKDRDHRQANAYFERSLSLFREAHFRIGIDNGLIFLSIAGQTTMHTEYAQMLTEAALNWLRVIKPEHPKVWLVLTGLASTAKLSKQLQLAATLLGAANRSVQTAKLDPNDIITIESDKAVLGAELGEIAFAEAWAAGNAMTNEQAIAYALESSATTVETSREQSNSSLSTASEPLSKRELEIMNLIAEGNTNQEIADQLYIGVSTVKKHISHIYDKLDAKNRTQAVVHARERQLLAR